MTSSQDAPEFDRGAHDEPAVEHTRPDDTDSLTVEAVGKITEALETVERARGHLYSFHQLTGSADLALGEGVDQLRRAGHSELAERIETELVGMNVLPGRWTFQIVEEYDDGYYARFTALERHVRDELLQGRRHVFEAEMKESRRTHARPARPRGAALTSRISERRGADVVPQAGAGSPGSFRRAAPGPHR